MSNETVPVWVDGIPGDRMNVYLAGFISSCIGCVSLLAMCVTAWCDGREEWKRLGHLYCLLFTSFAFSIGTLAQIYWSPHPDDANFPMLVTECVGLLFLISFFFLAISSTWRSAIRKETAWTVKNTCLQKASIVFQIGMFPFFLLGWWYYIQTDDDVFIVAKVSVIYTASFMGTSTVLLLLVLSWHYCKDRRLFRDMKSMFQWLLLLECLGFLLCNMQVLALMAIDARSRHASTMQASRFIFPIIQVLIVSFIFFIMEVPNNYNPVNEDDSVYEPQKKAPDTKEESAMFAIASAADIEQVQFETDRT